MRTCISFADAHILSQLILTRPVNSSEAHDSLEDVALNRGLGPTCTIAATAVEVQRFCLFCAPLRCFLYRDAAYS